jgi:hypothetical protein
MRELKQAEALYESVDAVISQPRLDLEVVGAVFLAADAPFEK